MIKTCASLHCPMDSKLRLTSLKISVAAINSSMWASLVSRMFALEEMVSSNEIFTTLEQMTLKISVNPDKIASDGKVVGDQLRRNCKTLVVFVDLGCLRQNQSGITIA